MSFANQLHGMPHGTIDQATTQQHKGEPWASTTTPMQDSYPTKSGSGLSSTMSRPRLSGLILSMLAFTLLLILESASLANAIRVQDTEDLVEW